MLQTVVKAKLYPIQITKTKPNEHNSNLNQLVFRLSRINSITT